MVIEELFRNGEELYRVIRRIPVHNFVDKKTGSIVPEAFNLWKEHLDADKVLKQNETFIFCETIPDAVIVS